MHHKLSMMYLSKNRINSRKNRDISILFAIIIKDAKQPLVGQIFKTKLYRDYIERLLRGVLWVYKLVHKFDGFDVVKSRQSSYGEKILLSFSSHIFTRMSLVER